MRHFICSICHGLSTGYGNNAAPVNNGRCCDDCNYSVVLTARLGMLGIGHAHFSNPNPASL